MKNVASKMFEPVKETTKKAHNSEKKLEQKISSRRSS